MIFSWTRRESAYRAISMTCSRQQCANLPHTTDTGRCSRNDARVRTIDWQDGHRCVYTISYLRSMCPCAQCRVVREGEQAPGKKSLLTILPGNYATPLSALRAELVGKYALRID